MRSKEGQALLEYLLVFGMMAGISTAMVKLISGYTNSSMASLGYALSNALSSGVCKSLCFYGNFGNGIP
ncbi:MAG: hypothetical protein OEY33_09085 [Bdellovibrionales bacterium]|jgi:uncharacterized transporter YbjL|nr:hypothetical protein [Bdellovibrionales bacterium]